MQYLVRAVFSKDATRYTQTRGVYSEANRYARLDTTCGIAIESPIERHTIALGSHLLVNDWQKIAGCGRIVAWQRDTLLTKTLYDRIGAVLWKAVLVEPRANRLLRLSNRYLLS